MYKFILVYFGDMEDEREAKKVKHDLYEIIFMAFIGILCGVDGYNEMEEFVKEQEEWFLKYIELKNGVPSHDTFRKVLNMLDPNEFGKRFKKVMEEIISLSGKEKEEEHLQIDGKSIKGSRYLDKKTGKHKMIHTVNVLSKTYGLSICQKTVEGSKYVSENEAIKEILSFIDLKKTTVSVDAGMSHKDIAEQIIEKKGNYVFALKENNKKTFLIVKEYINNFGIMEKDKCKYTEEEEGHGRKTKRVFYSYKLPIGVKEKIEFKNIESVGVYESYDLTTNELNDRRYFITSKKNIKPEEFYLLCRNHWDIENKLHWILDVVFNEDKSKIKKGNGPKILLVLRQLGFNLLKMDLTKGSFKSKIRKFLWNQNYRDKLLNMSITNWRLL